MKHCFLLLVSLVITPYAWAESDGLERKIRDTPVVIPENIIAEDFTELGEIVASFRQARYLTNNDVVYLRMSEAVSVGDRFSIYVDRGKVKVPGAWLSKKGRKIQILGNLQITDVTPQWVVGKIYDAKEDIVRGNKIGPIMDLKVQVNPQEPKQMIRGKVLSAAKSIETIGSFEFAFIDKGRSDGLHINDRLLVYRKGDGVKTSGDFPEVPIAELVVVQLDENVGTVYTLSGNEAFGAGADFKSAISEVKYLDEDLQGSSEKMPQLQ